MGATLFCIEWNPYAHQYADFGFMISYDDRPLSPITIPSPLPPFPPPPAHLAQAGNRKHKYRSKQAIGGDGQRPTQKMCTRPMLSATELRQRMGQEGILLRSTCLGRDGKRLFQKVCKRWVLQSTELRDGRDKKSRVLR